MATVIAFIEVLPIILTALFAIWGAWEKIKARKFEEAFEVSDRALAGVVATIELIPMDPEEKKLLKSKIQDVSVKIETEGPKMAKIVQEVYDIIKKSGVVVSDDAESTFAAARAVNIYRKKNI